MLLSLIRPTTGQIRMFGMDLQAHRREILRQVGAVIESPDLYTYLNGYENLEIFARLSGVRAERSRLMQKLDQVGLADRSKDKVRNYSQGMKQRLGIAVAMVHDPGLIVLDEPTNGLDPQGIADIRNLILFLSREQGKTVIVSSHLLSEIEQVATRLLIIDKGRKVAEGPLRELLDPEQVVLELDTTDNTRCLHYLQGSAWKEMSSVGQSGKLLLSIARTRVPDLARELMQEGFGIRSLDPQNALESYFLSLTQNHGDVVAR
jgi:ABC-2 type transport system ATP-binding protein